MNTHTLSLAPGSKHRRSRVGRGMGSGKGKTCGKGHKGQMARKGHKHKAGHEGGQMPFIRRVPKRGFNNINRCEYVPVNVAALDQLSDGTEVTIDVLEAAGLATGARQGVKILGMGELSKKLTVRVQAFSESARSKIEAAGGACEVVKMG